MAKFMTDAQLKEFMTEFVETAIANGEVTEANCHDLKTRSDIVGKFLAAKRDEYKVVRGKCLAAYLDVVDDQFGPAEPEAATTETKAPVKAESKPEPVKPTQTAEPTEPTETNDEPAEKPVEKPAPRTPRRTPRTPKKSIDDLVESAETTTPRSSRSNSKSRTETVGRTTSAPRSKLIYARCAGLSINNPPSAFNLKEAAEPGAFDTTVVDVKEAEIEFLETILTKEQVEEYTTTYEDFVDAVDQLYEAYPIEDPTGKKHQHFTPVKTSMKKNDGTITVKYIDPKSEKLTLTPLPEDDAAIFYDNILFMEKFAETIKAKLTPPKPPKQDKQSKSKLSKKEKDELEKKKKEESEKTRLQPLDYLLLSVVNTQNIIKSNFFAKLPEIRNEDIVKVTNTVREPINEEDIRSLCNQLKPENAFAPDYMQLFIDIKGFNGSNYDSVVKSIYTHREAILNHPKLTRDLKEAAWLQALGNLQAIEQSIPNDTESRLIYDCWINVLSSKFAFYIVMYNAPPNDFFKKGFELLIQQPLSIKLYESALYPISFIFTPNMLGYNDYEPNVQKIFGKQTDASYKQNIVNEWYKFGTASTKHYDYNECAWLFYFNKSDLINQMVSLLHKAIELLDKPVTPRGSKSKDKGDENTDEPEDENTDNDN